MRERCLKNILDVFFSAAFLVLSVNSGVYAQNQGPKDVEQLDFANGLFQRDLYDMAIAEYREFISSFPDSSYLHDAYFGIAESFFVAEDYQEAIEACNRYIKLFPKGEKKVFTTLRLGQALFFAGQYDEARLIFVAIKPDALDKSAQEVLFFYLGRTFQIHGNHQEALKYFEKAAQDSQKGKYRIFALLEIGDIFLADAKYEQADEYYAKAYQGTDADNTKSLAMFKQGEVQFLLENYTKAIDVFKKILEQYPKQDIISDALTNLLLASFNIFRYEEVIAEYLAHKEIIADNEQFFDAHYIAARAYFQTARYEKALALLDKILIFDSVNAEDESKVLFKKAEIFIKAGRLKDAVALTEEKLEKLPLNKDYTMFLKAEAYYALQDFNKAYGLYKQIIEEFSAQKTNGKASSFVESALYGMAHAQNSLGNTTEAMDLFFKYFESGKDEAKRREALYNEILIGAQMDFVERTIEHGELYLSRFEEDDREEKVAFLLGTLYPRVEEYNKAIEVFTQFVTKFPESEKLQEVYFLLAYNFQLLDKFEEAMEYYKKLAPNKGEKSLYYPALKNTALIHLNKGKDVSAAKTYDKIITAFKKNDLEIKIYFWLVQQYITGKKFDDALRILEKAEENFRDSKDLEGIKYFKAEVFRKTNAFGEAIEQYDAILETADENIYLGAAHIGKGLCLIETKNYEMAKGEFGAAIRKNLGDNTITMRARFEMGNIERLMERPEEASKFYMLVAVLYRDDFYCPEALFRAGEIFESLEKKDKALNVYREIVSGYGQSHLNEKAAERIKALGAN